MAPENTPPGNAQSPIEIPPGSRTVKESHAEMNEIVQPNDLNINQAMFGGKLVDMIDKVAAIAGYRHSHQRIATLSIDSLIFKKPIPAGHIITLRASVNRVFRTSMEIGVKVTSWSAWTPAETNVCSAYLTFVSIDEQHHPQVIPQIQPESEDEWRRYRNALIRREARILLDKTLNSH